MVEAEEEYLEQLQLMVSCFLRPFKMAASSQKPPCTHDEVNSIFLNAETVMFLHQIFLKGLTARMECWPTLVLGMRTIFVFYCSMLLSLSLYSFFTLCFVCTAWECVFTDIIVGCATEMELTIHVEFAASSFACQF